MNDGVEESKHDDEEEGPRAKMSRIARAFVTLLRRRPVDHMCREIMCRETSVLSDRVPDLKLSPWRRRVEESPAMSPLVEGVDDFLTPGEAFEQEEEKSIEVVDDGEDYHSVLQSVGLKATFLDVVMFQGAKWPAPVHSDAALLRRLSLCAQPRSLHTTHPRALHIIVRRLRAFLYRVHREEERARKMQLEEQRCRNFERRLRVLRLLIKERAVNQRTKQPRVDGKVQRDLASSNKFALLSDPHLESPEVEEHAPPASTQPPTRSRNRRWSNSNKRRTSRSFKQHVKVRACYDGGKRAVEVRAPGPASRSSVKVPPSPQEEEASLREESLGVSLWRQLNGKHKQILDGAYSGGVLAPFRYKRGAYSGGVFAPLRCLRDDIVSQLDNAQRRVVTDAATLLSGLRFAPRELLLRVCKLASSLLQRQRAAEEQALAEEERLRLAYGLLTRQLLMQEIRYDGARRQIVRAALCTAFGIWRAAKPQQRRSHLFDAIVGVWLLTFVIVPTSDIVVLRRLYDAGRFDSCELSEVSMRELFDLEEGTFRANFEASLRLEEGTFRANFEPPLRRASSDAEAEASILGSLLDALYGNATSGDAEAGGEGETDASVVTGAGAIDANVSPCGAWTQGKTAGSCVRVGCCAVPDVVHGGARSKPPAGRKKKRGLGTPRRPGNTAGVTPNRSGETPDPKRPVSRRTPEPPTNRATPMAFSPDAPPPASPMAVSPPPGAGGVGPGSPGPPQMAEPPVPLDARRPRRVASEGVRRATEALMPSTAARGAQPAPAVAFLTEDDLKERCRAHGVLHVYQGPCGHELRRPGSIRGRNLRKARINFMRTWHGRLAFSIQNFNGL